MRKPRWALFISGQGTNMSALLDEKWDLDVALVVSSSSQSPGLLRAKRCGIPTMVLEKKIDWQLVLENLQQQKVTHVFLLGFMKIVPPEFLKQWTGVVLNVHPSLLPSYQGLKSIERAYDDGADLGVTVHHVSSEVDAGDIVLQKKVIVKEQLSEMSLSQAKQKIHWAEYQLVRQAVEKKYA
ncbi:phosphoribosylglycinamide formyltransferase [bacterium]|nr:phosphoribosylglycinamide formyltransferase [bacterium]